MGGEAQQDPRSPQPWLVFEQVQVQVVGQNNSPNEGRRKKAPNPVTWVLYGLHKSWQPCSLTPHGKRVPARPATPTWVLFGPALVQAVTWLNSLGDVSPSKTPALPHTSLGAFLISTCTGSHVA